MIANLPGRYGVPLNPGEFWPYAILSLTFLGLAAIYLIHLGADYSREVPQ